MREFAKHERSREVAREAACCNAWIKKKAGLKILAVMSTCTVIPQSFLFSYSWSFGILLWEMATMGKCFLPLFLKLVITFLCQLRRREFISTFIPYMTFTVNLLSDDFFDAFQEVPRIPR